MSLYDGTGERLLESLIAKKSFPMYQHTAMAAHEQEAKRIANVVQLNIRK